MQGGGVAIIYDTNSVNFNGLTAGKKKFEIISAIGRRTAQRRKVIAIGAYIPPGLDAEENREFLDNLGNIVRQFKVKYKTLYFIIAGDFNQRKVEEELREFSDIRKVVTPPTRGRNTLDIVFTNFPEYITEAGVTDPLFSEEGTQSDHKTVYVRPKIPRVPQYTKQVYEYVQRTKEGDEQMRTYLRQQHWTKVTDQHTTDLKVARLHQIIQNGIEKAYKLVKRTKKSSEPQWMSPYIRRRIKRRRAVFRRAGRCETWKKLKSKTQRIIDKRGTHFNKIKKDKLLGENKQNFHACVKAFVNDDKTATWDVKTLFESKTAEQVAEECADFFNGISSEYAPLSHHDIPTSYHRQLPVITEQRIIEEVKKARKTSSVVPGDLYRDLLEESLDVLARVISDIYNTIIGTNKWPDDWKREHVTIIPKKRNPENLGQCRNLSCTNFLGKILEKIVLAWSRDEVQPKINQYGGERECSTNHMLVDMYDSITESLEDSRAAVAITSIEYSKAFNRLQHGQCLEAFRKKGASTQVMAILAAFLTQRTMTVKVDGARSSPRMVNAGAPQGSVLGTYIFNVGTDALEEDFPPMKKILRTSN